RRRLGDAVTVTPSLSVSAPSTSVTPSAGAWTASTPLALTARGRSASTGTSALARPSDRTRRPKPSSSIAEAAPASAKLRTDDAVTHVHEAVAERYRARHLDHRDRRHGGPGARERDQGEQAGDAAPRAHGVDCRSVRGGNGAGSRTASFAGTGRHAARRRRSA